ncbi:DUF1007 family protein [Spirochaeta cellobiosiphila]|uniref:DUF1007 family protein n=1 Tax=Spirochaeta cellobiosiphila TaxID=504483 RepID=UPI0004154542|nr:DUF1007 family protein [Spirochaeta cellobiosiphila]
MKNFFYILLLFLSPSLWAHPHLWIDVDLNFTSSGLLHVHWTFDEYFSSDMILNYDVNRNDILEQNEQDEINRIVFRNMINYDYFLDIVRDGKKVDIPLASNFKASIKNHKLIYDFDVPLKQSWNDMEIIPWDKTYFADMRLTSCPDSIPGTNVTVIQEKLKRDTLGWGTIEVPGVFLKEN